MTSQTLNSINLIETLGRLACRHSLVYCMLNSDKYNSPSAQWSGVNIILKPDETFFVNEINGMDRIQL